MKKKNCLVFGASGVIGAETCARFESQGYEVYRSSRTANGNESQNLVATGDTEIDGRAMENWPTFHAVIWAQGSNINDSIVKFSAEDFENTLSANVNFVASTMAELLSQSRILDGAKLCVISSIWQDATRQEKLSYMVSKAALGALVRSVSTDLACRGIFVNAILPGVLDSPMTQGVLSSDQINSVKNRTGFGRLVTPSDLSSLIYFLCSELNNCVSGQSIVADLGFSNVRPV